MNYIIINICINKYNILNIINVRTLINIIVLIT